MFRRINSPPYRFQQDDSQQEYTRMQHSLSLPESSEQGPRPRHQGQSYPTVPAPLYPALPPQVQSYSKTSPLPYPTMSPQRQPYSVMIPWAQPCFQRMHPPFYPTMPPQEQPYSALSLQVYPILSEYCHFQPNVDHDPLKLRHSITLHPSLYEFQRRGEDELAKFFHQVVDYASKYTIGKEKKPLNLNYEEPGMKKQHKNASSVLGRASLDFRWLMKHLEYNGPKYSRYIFKSQLSGDEIKRICQALRTKADELAHQQDLYNRTDSGKNVTELKPVDIEPITEFFQTSIEFTRKAEQSLKKEIQNLATNKHNLESIFKTFQDMCNYRKLYQANKESYQKMSMEEKSQSCDATLKLLISKATGDHYRQMISVEFAAHCKIELKYLIKESETQDEETDQEWKTQGREATPLGAIRDVQDTVIGKRLYTLDPFLPSNMEMQQRLENRLVLFFRTAMSHIVLSGVGKNWKYRDLKEQDTITAEKALERPCSFDFRSLMELMKNNHMEYGGRHVKSLSDNLKRMADDLVHKFHLHHRLAQGSEAATSGVGTTDALTDFLEYGLELARIVCESHCINHAPVLDPHWQRLVKIRQVIEHFMKYRKVHHSNMKFFKDVAYKQQVTQKVLDHLQEKKDELQPLIVVEFLARCGKNINELFKTESEVEKKQIKETKIPLTNRFDSLHLPSETDD